MAREAVPLLSRASVRSHPRRPSSRALAVFLLAIVGPTLVLLYLGLATARRQHQVIVGLEALTSRLTAESLVRVIDAEVSDRAAGCLLDARIAAAVQTAAWEAPATVQRVRRTLDATCASHPVCRELVVLTDDGGAPRLEDPLPWVGSADADTVRAGSATLREGEQHQAAARPTLAAAAYQRIVAGPAAPQVRAVALSRLGSLQVDAGEPVRAFATWDTLFREYADTYDGAQRPQGLVAALHLQRVAAALPPQVRARAAKIVTGAIRDLREGRWVVSPGQAEYFIDRLANDRSTNGRDGRLFRQFALARGLRADLDALGTPRPGAVRSFGLTSSDMTETQAFATSVATANGAVVVALAIDADWVRSHVAHDVARATAGPEAAASVRIVPAGGEGVPFRQALSSRALTFDTAAGGNGLRAESVVFGGTIAGVLAVLGLGVALLVRDASREAATARLRADLMHGVSHELRTPLTVIRLYAESLADDLPAGDARAAHSRVILHESQRLGHLVERVLEFSRAERMPIAVTPELHDPTTLVQEFATRYRPYLAHLGFELSVVVEDVTSVILVDAAALTQALVNLVDNAVKYAVDSSRLCLRVVDVEGIVAIDVEDGGPGIDPADRARVLEPYVRGGHTGERGHGLGLHLVAAIMEAHGGSIEVGDAAGGGTRVRLRFPARTDEASN